MLLIARKIVGDGSVIQWIPGKGFRMFREPAPGELFERYEATLARLKARHADETLIEVATAQALQHAAGAGEPAVIIGVEGGDFLEGDIQRLEAARQRGITRL